MEPKLLNGLTAITKESPHLLLSLFTSFGDYCKRKTTNLNKKKHKNKVS